MIINHPLKKAFIFVLLISAVLLSTQVFGFNPVHQENHLMFLRKAFQIHENKVFGYVIYADTKGGEFVHASAPGEGMTCVDDTARAGIYFLRKYADCLDPHSENARRYLSLALETIDFCQCFRTTEGDYYNFLFEDGSINEHGITSRPSKSWWALRALWLLSESLNILSNEKKFDKDYYYHQALNTALLFKSELDTTGLIRGYTDLSSLYVIGLSNLYRYGHDEQLKGLIVNVSDGIVAKQQDVLFSGIIDEGTQEFNFHSWGSRQVQALAMAFQITGKHEYLESACKMADNLYPHMINMGPLYAYNRVHITLYPQIAYGIEAAVASLYALYQIEENEKYALMMSLLHGFFYGNNHLNTPMVTETGQGYDGLESVFINRNAGAESTISFLLSQSLVDRLNEKFSAYSKITVLKKSSPILINIETMNAGLSNVEHAVENGFSGLTGNSFKLREMKSISTGAYQVFLLGNRLTNGTCSLTLSKSSISTETPKNQSPVFIGKIIKPENEKEIDTKIMLSAKFEENAFLSQLLLLPEWEYQIFKEPQAQSQKIWVYNTNPTDTIHFELYGLNEAIAPQSFMVKEITPIIEETTQNKEERFEPKLIINPDHHAVMVEIVDIVNNNGVGTPLNPANFDNLGGSKGAYFPEDILKKNSTDNVLITNTIPFWIDNEAVNDNILANGQIILINQNGSFLYLIGSCDHGSFSGELEIGYNNGEERKKEYIQLTFPDWCESGVNEKMIAGEWPYRYNSQDLKEWITPKMYIQKIALQSETIEYIKLPLVPTMHIFGITLTD